MTISGFSFVVAEVTIILSLLEQFLWVLDKKPLKCE